MAQTQPHFLLITYPAQGHLNPALQFAKQLIRLGVKLTFPTTVNAYHRMGKAGKIPESLNYVLFSDGYDDGFNPDTDDATDLLAQFREKGTECLKETILSSAKNGTPVTCLVYTLLIPWAAEVARDCNVPPALLWIQPASVFRVYYYYFKGYDKLIGENCNEPSWSIELPGLPLLKSRDLPSFCLPSNASDPVLNTVLLLIKELLHKLDSIERPKILVNTFNELEEEALKEMDGKVNMVGVGPLIPSAFLDGKDMSDRSFGGDLIEASHEYLEWMNTKPKGSIVYISFGTLIVWSKKQKEAMAHGLLESNRPFLWVIKDKDREEADDEISYMHELKKLGLGLMIPWCNQLEVLSHPSLGCFVTHCGWNSTLESMACGVPLVAVPKWSDQTTNAKLIEDLWGAGVRVTTNEEGVVEGEEMKRCIEMVMGGHERGEVVRGNVKKWKDLARKPMKEGGSSYMNLKAFVEEVGSCTYDKVVS
ncbi:putative crocetin glucosyltransferase [Helianthus annuus]|nr:putative crocetin glucosyltransferase [Helianthus annuus]KAJ0467789.1 putative crocetin glucosyltransferase [Helianthus annuus]